MCVCVTTKPFQVSTTFISVCCKLSECWCVRERARLPGLVPFVRFIAAQSTDPLFVGFFVRVFLYNVIKNSFMSFSVYIYLYIFYSLYYSTRHCFICDFFSLCYIWICFFSLCTFDDEEKKTNNNSKIFSCIFV